MQNSRSHDLLFYSSALSFQVVLCIIPTVFLIVWVLGTFLSRETLLRQLEVIITYALPQKFHSADEIRNLFLNRARRFAEHRRFFPDDEHGRHDDIYRRTGGSNAVAGRPNAPHVHQVWCSGPLCSRTYFPTVFLHLPFSIFRKIKIGFGGIRCILGRYSFRVSIEYFCDIHIKSWKSRTALRHT